MLRLCVIIIMTIIINLRCLLFDTGGFLILFEIIDRCKQVVKSHDYRSVFTAYMCIYREKHRLYTKGKKKTLFLTNQNSIIGPYYTILTLTHTRWHSTLV